MRLIRNSGNDRAVDELRRCLVPRGTFDAVSPAFSLFAFAELQKELARPAKCRLVIPPAQANNLSLLGGSFDRAYRNRLQRGDTP